MLLTSSQVSIALSSSIVLIFTTALFLSGYAIQQRTLRDLRAAIRAPPQPEPKIFLPDRFKTSTTELPDGTIIEVNDDGSAPTGSRSSNNQKPLRGGRARKQRQRQGQQQRGKNEEIVIEIKPTLPLPEEKAGGANAQRAVKDTHTQVMREKHRAPSSSTNKSEKKQPQQNGKQQQQQQQQQVGVKGQGGGKGKKDQKEKVLLPGPDAVPHPEDEGKFVSRAERRRLIKEELQRLSRGSERVYWQRRLW
ncbi:hypothetical protein QBC37DRAFT_348146 [Rhypophila decipiens]|uniref:Uncharacterized protein n=1 Tax=Rhypophila decipiens TaxID=261697 RepID=A0AAN6Y2G7_9PEZI|nr:hypothetical protein QBC37DRAFT_348146 [Rhypophila decipiens]